MGLHKILRIVALILSVAGIIFLAMIVAKGDDVVKATGEGVDGYLYVAYITFAIVLLFVIVFVLKGIAAGNIKKTLITVGAFLAVVIVSYALADSTPMKLSDNTMMTESASRWAGAGLYTFYILAVLAIGAMVLSGIKKIAK